MTGTIMTKSIMRALFKCSPHSLYLYDPYDHPTKVSIVLAIPYEIEKMHTLSNMVPRPTPAIRSGSSAWPMK